MPRVHFVKRARKARPEHGIEVGDSYYWWKFRTGGRGGAKRISKTPPKKSQLTQSDYLQRVYGVEEDLEGRLRSSEGSADDLRAELDAIADEVSDIAEEQSEKLSNLPEGLQESETGELLQERSERMEEWADEIRSLDVEDADGNPEPVDTIIQMVLDANPGD